MSIAGIRSNRGDYYQTLIAFKWALDVLSDPACEWLEIDSTTYRVDDVVIGKSDGSLICCQCKKNHPDFKAWSIKELADEIGKASEDLLKFKQAKVHFYSRNNFGLIQKLHEYRASFDNETDYINNFTLEHKEIDRELGACIAEHSPGLTAYEFLRRTSFNTTEDYELMENNLRVRLHNMAAIPAGAFDTIYLQLSKLSSRNRTESLSVSTQHRLSKDDLKTIISQSGAMLVPAISSREAISSFTGTSAIGRTWLRDIAGKQFTRPAVKEILEAINVGKRSILLTGLPGSGKTCVMLNLQEELERIKQNCSDLVPLFIQSREFADLATAQDRHLLGLPDNWVGQAARLAESTKVVVVIDSLDVLAIAREHNILSYFLAQIDKLLLIPNITVVTACRDFDRKYEHRIAVREWDCEFQCLPLNWENEIAPLLDDLSIDLNTIDQATRELIRNPRELDLFVKLALREGSFNVVTSQALAQRYLDTIEKADPLLGDTAIQAIESIANIMLQERTLSIAPQRFSATSDILLRLKSHNVLQCRNDEKLSFGHQTLLDVLVVSRAIRRGDSLNDFIKGLSPVPFVRPSIRSFVAQLAAGDRRIFRRQIRTVLTGDLAFHIRRLVAEAFSQQIPQDDDLPLILHLRDNNREIFQVIYAEASLVQWHHFWLVYLVPEMKAQHDSNAVIGHVHRIKQWMNEDAAGVVKFWLETLQLDWLNNIKVAEILSFSLREFTAENLPLIKPILEQLLSIPQLDKQQLGGIVARCNSANIIDDEVLWHFVVGEISEDDLMKSHFGNKLHCQVLQNEESKKDYLKQRMLGSTVLLDLALQTIEQWSHLNEVHYGQTRIGYREGYLRDTSYFDAHSETDVRLIDEIRILFDAIEAAVLNNAQKHSDWWLHNRERLCFNQEGALCYCAVRALTNSPQQNIVLIGRLLCDKNLLEFSLSYELGELIRVAFIYLDTHTQVEVINSIVALWQDTQADDGPDSWILKQRAGYISAIPCHLRTVEAQGILDAHEKVNGFLFQRPSIDVWSGTINAPFSYDVFINAKDQDVIRLLSHYTGYCRNGDDFLTGGELEVGMQLCKASSLYPSRFLNLLTIYWSCITANFHDDIMEGVSLFLSQYYGNMQSSSDWIPCVDTDAASLANQVLDELERHPIHWQHNRAAAKALEGCAFVIQDASNGARLVFLAIGFAGMNEEVPIQDSSGNLINIGINTMSGNIVESLMILAGNFNECGATLPALLEPTLHRFAENKNPAIRSLILRRLHVVQSWNPTYGWDLFKLAMQDAEGLWVYTEPCLYYAIRDKFEIVSAQLARMYSEGSHQELAIWGRISALSALSGHIDFTTLADELDRLDTTEAWQGASDVWTHPRNIDKHREQCLAGIEKGLNAQKNHAVAVARKMNRIYQDDTPFVSIPIELIGLYFAVLQTDSENRHRDVFGFTKWLNVIFRRDPGHALAATEIYITYLSNAVNYFYDHENLLVQLMTSLFAESEEREESDKGSMLARVVRVQDLLLSVGGNSINDWLNAAERP
jgi:hypothetical protein